MKLSPLLCLLLWLAACAPAAPPVPTVQVKVYATAAAKPWLEEAFSCAGSEALLNISASPDGADLVLRIGEAAGMGAYTYQIDNEQILVVAHPQPSLQNLDTEQVRELFAGRADASLQLWAYGEGQDLQQAFDAMVMQGQAVSPQARLAADPENMLASLGSDPNAVGLLPRHWPSGDLRELYSTDAIPVLAITRTEPEGAIKNLVACLQQ